MSSEKEAHPDSFEQVHPDTPHEEVQPPGIEQIVQQIRETADKLIRDHAARG